MVLGLQGGPGRWPGAGLALLSDGRPAAVLWGSLPTSTPSWSSEAGPVLQPSKQGQHPSI